MDVTICERSRISSSLAFVSRLSDWMSWSNWNGTWEGGSMSLRRSSISFYIEISHFRTEGGYEKFVDTSFS